MSALYNQTNITPGTTQFITRAEVQNALSTLAGDLSGADLSTLFYNPNPKFSTISLPPTGSISYPGSLQAIALAISSTGGLNSQDMNGYGNQSLVVAKSGLTTDIYAKNFIADNTPINVPTSTNRLLYSYSGISGTNFNQQNSDFLKWNPLTNTNPWYLVNVSSINGQPPGTAGGTFTTLTGSNLISQIVNTSQVIGVSSMNGVPYVAPASSTYSGTATPAIPTGTLTSCFTITLPAATLAPNRNYLFDVPFQLGAFPPSPTNFQLLIGIRLGTNGITNVQMPYWIATNSTQPITLQLSGIASTNPVSVASQTIEIMAIQSSGSTWTAPFSAPASGSGNNVWTLKALS